MAQKELVEQYGHPGHFRRGLRPGVHIVQGSNLTGGGELIEYFNSWLVYSYLISSTHAMDWILAASGNVFVCSRRV